MKYETMYRMQERCYDVNEYVGANNVRGWGFSSHISFEPKEQYSVYNLIEYIPGNIVWGIGRGFLYFGLGIQWLYNHRAKLIIAKKPTSCSESAVYGEKKE